MRMTANQWARWDAARRNNHPPRETLKERIWRQAYRRYMLTRGFTLADVVGMFPEVDFAYTPEESAEEEIYYMAQDAEPIDQGA